MKITDKLKWQGWWPVFFLSILTIAILSLFIDKAFSIDDPVYCWIAQHIQTHPLDPYGFKINWFSTDVNIWQFINNPPLVSYYIVLVTLLFGWTERVIHSAFVIPALGVVLGTYFLAKRWCSSPILAGLMVLAMPVFLVSGTTVMCDVMMLAFWVWAVFFWVRGIENNDYANLILAGVFIAAAFLTKFYGASLIVYLSLYAILKRCPLRLWGGPLLIPAMSLMGYHWAMKFLYGNDPLFSAAAYAADNHVQGALFYAGMTGLSFLGGCLLGAIFFLPFLWSRKNLLIHGTVFIGLVFLSMTIWAGAPSYRSFFPDLQTMFQFLFFIITGVSILSIVMAETWETRKDPVSITLFCWILGTFIFASFINWSLNGRVLLPIVPAVVIVMVRGMDRRGTLIKKLGLVIAVILGCFASIIVAAGDAEQANSEKTAAYEIYGKYGSPSSDIIFGGHWGFQYYMELLGGKALNGQRQILRAGDVVVIPQNNTNAFILPMKNAKLQEILNVPVHSYIVTMNGKLGAGFYSNAWGKIPFSIGPVSPDQYLIFKILPQEKQQ